MFSFSSRNFTIEKQIKSYHEHSYLHTASYGNKWHENFELSLISNKNYFNSYLYAVQAACYAFKYLNYIIIIYLKFGHQNIHRMFSHW